MPLGSSGRLSFDCGSKYFAVAAKPVASPHSVWLTWLRCGFHPLEFAIPIPGSASRYDLRQEPGAAIPLAGIRGGGGERSPSLLRPLVTSEQAQAKKAIVGPK